MKYPLLLLAIICLLFSACGKKYAIRHNVDAGAKQFYGYKPGSFWVFKDSLGGHPDSIYIDNYSDAFTYYHDPITTGWSAREAAVSHGIAYDLANGKQADFFVAVGADPSLTIVLGDYRFSEGSYTTYFAPGVFINDTDKVNDSGKITIAGISYSEVQLFNTYTMNGANYDSVFCIHNYYRSARGNSEDTYQYVNRKNGIVQLKYITDTTGINLQLLRSNLVR